LGWPLGLLLCGGRLRGRLSRRRSLLGLLLSRRSLSRPQLDHEELLRVRAGAELKSDALAGPDRVDSLLARLGREHSAWPHDPALGVDREHSRLAPI
jgi:hypothetical protein